MTLAALLTAPPCAAAELLGHVEREHTAVPEGCFGASGTVFMPWNYQVVPWPGLACWYVVRAVAPAAALTRRLSVSQIKTTPRDEFRFAWLAPDDPSLPAATLGTKEGEQL